MNSIDAALIEARNPETTPERLQKLSEWKLRAEREELRQLIASNPNVNDGLLWQLASDYPQEVIVNPRFQLLLLSAEPLLEDVDLLSLCTMALAVGNETPPAVKFELRTRFEELYSQYSQLVEIERREEWAYGRRVVLTADDYSGRVPFDITLEVELEALMVGGASVWLESGGYKDSFSENWLASLLDGLRCKSIEQLFESFGCQQELFDIPMKNPDRETIKINASSVNEMVGVDDCAVVFSATGEKLFNVRVFYWANENAMPAFNEEGCLDVSVHQHVGGDFVGHVRGSNDDLGDLEPLWGWEPVHLSLNIPKDSWEQWLSEWILD